MDLEAIVAGPNRTVGLWLTSGQLECTWRQWLLCSEDSELHYRDEEKEEETFSPDGVDLLLST